MNKIVFFVFLMLISWGKNSWAEALVIIVNKDNPVETLSIEEVKRFFLLKAKRWPNGLKVNPVNREQDAKIKRTLIFSVLEMDPSGYQNYWIDVKQKSGETEPQSVRSNRFTFKIVQRRKGAIGYLPETYFNQLPPGKRALVKKVLTVH